MHFTNFLRLCLHLFFLQSSTTRQDFQVRWRRPRVLGEPGRFTNFVNQPRDFIRLYKQVFFDACPYMVKNSSLRNIDFYQWTIFRDLKKKEILYDFNGTSCLHEWKAPTEGAYTIRATAHKTDASFSTATEKFFVKDIWLVAMGDSFAAGQGNPDVIFVDKARPSQWVNNTCFRSSFGSFSYLIYDKIVEAYPQHGVLFTYIACSEASVNSGLLGPQEYQNGQVTEILEPIIATAQKEAYLSKDPSAKTAPDLVLLTVGANDIGFFEVSVDLVMGILTIDSSFQRLNLPQKLANFTTALGQLQQHFKSSGIDSNSVFYFEYFDPVHNEKGELDSSCAGMFLATKDDLRIAYESVLRPLNFLIRNQSHHFGWHCVDNIAEAFRRHGICSKQSYIRTMEGSLQLQGTAFGIFHPTYAGHRLVTRTAWPKISDYLAKKFRRQ